MIENPAYAAAVAGKKLVLSLAFAERDEVTELGHTLTTQPGDWLVRHGMDVMLMREWPLPQTPDERRFNMWIVRHANRIIARIPVPLQILRGQGLFTLSRALCIPERIEASE